MIAFGPVPSRRLGQSIGINNIPPKICTYSCVYCQLGQAIKMDDQRRGYYNKTTVVQAVKDKIASQQEPDNIDYLTFVPDGEPTLDVHLGEEVKELKQTGIKTAIITNASLMNRQDVQEELMAFDWVSLKVDAVDYPVWKKTDRPYKTLDLEGIKQGMLDFAARFTGKLVTETMLIDAYNTHEDNLKAVAAFIHRLNPSVKYLAIPTRPPAVSKIMPAGETQLARAYEIFSHVNGRTEYLIGYEGNAFAASGNTEEDILSITSVHPMRHDAMKELLKNNNANWGDVQKLIRAGKLIEAEYRGNTYYVRKLRDKQMK